MPPAKQNLDPVEQSVHVDCPIEDAFRLFTENFAEWWPLDDQAQIEPWKGGRVLGSNPGIVTTWDPPHRVAFTWSPRPTRDDDQSVTVDFTVEADGTRVTLTHYNWHRTAIETCAARFSAMAAQAFALA